MSAISTILARLRAAIWAIDVRDDIANAIEQCYSDVSNPTLKTEALEAALQNKIDEGEMAALTIGDGTITAAKLASGVIDNTLATSGAAADAKKTGDELSALKADLGSYTWHRKGNINLTTDPVVLTPTSNAGMDCLVAECSVGDVFNVTAIGGASSRAWGFLDSGNHVLTVADANTQVEELEITAPTNAVKIVVNNKFRDGDGLVFKVGNNLISRVNNIEDVINGLNTNSEVQNNGIGIILVSLLNKLGLTDPDSDDYLKNNILHLFREQAPVNNNDAYDCARYMYYNFNSYKLTRGSKKNSVVIFRGIDIKPVRVSYPPVLYNGETITTKTGYEMSVYELGDIDFCNTYTISDYQESSELGGFGYCQNHNPSWETQYSSTSQSVKYIMMKFRKSDGSDFSLYEFTHMRGTVFEVTGTTKSAADYFALEAGGYTPTTLYHYTDTDKHRVRIVYNDTIGKKRCRSKIIPVSKGNFIAKDGYLITLYELDEFGRQTIGYSGNTKASGYPGYVKEAKIRDNCMFVALVFKKTDETDFSDSEIANAYGTVFEYEGGDKYDVI